MNIRLVAVLATLSVSIAGAASADSLDPTQGRFIDLGQVSGVAYYTVEHDGFHVVATLGQGDAGTPVRVEAVLVQGQSVTLSTPREVGMEPVSVLISRQNDRLIVSDSPALTH